MTKKRGWIVWLAVALTVIELCSLASMGAYALLKKKKCKHEWSEGEVTIEATCAREGELTFTCKECGEVRVETLDVVEHSLSNYAARAPTCTEVGWDAYQKCSTCEYSTKQEKKALGHALVQAAAGIAATCTTQGKTPTMKCTRCDHVEGGEATPARGTHTWEIACLDDFGEEPTCTTPGKTAKQTCTACGVTQGGETLPAGHKYKNGVCTRCGASE